MYFEADLALASEIFSVIITKALHRETNVRVAGLVSNPKFSISSIVT